MTFDWESPQILRCKYCQLPVFIPSWMVGLPFEVAQFLELKEQQHSECSKFSTPEEARKNRKWLIALHYAQLESKRKERRQPVTVKA